MEKKTFNNQLGILNDKEIKRLCLTYPPMISPFTAQQLGRPSWGLGSFGYDIRLGPNFLVPLGGVNAVLDPLNFPQEMFHKITRRDYIVIAPRSQILAESMEEFNMPDDVMGVCWGKSTYARCGLLVNLTPAEPQWKGKLTIELANLSPLPIKLHVNQGIAQMVFFRGERPMRTYAEKEAGGIYQDQRGVTLPQ